MRFKRSFLGWSLVFPALLLATAFVFFPVYGAFKLSLYSTNGLREPVFLGLGNFIDLIHDQTFWASFIVLGKFMLVVIPVNVLGPLIGAKLLFNVRSSKLSYFFRVLFIIPMVVPGMVWIKVWQELYSPSGAINNILDLIGLHSMTHSWLGDESTALYSIVFAGFPWMGGASLLIYLAGFMNISKSLYETLEIEGVSWFYTFFKVEIPTLFPQIRLIMVLAILDLVHNYNDVLIFTNGGPNDSTLTPALYMFRSAFSSTRLGYGTTIGIILFFISLILSYLNFKLIKGRSK